MSEDEEKEANYFAICLLMPEKFLRRDLEGGIDMADDSKIKRLAKKYGVTKSLMALRICQLGIIG